MNLSQGTDLSELLRPESQYRLKLNALNPAYTMMNGIVYKKPTFRTANTISPKQRLILDMNKYYGFDPLAENPDLNPELRKARDLQDYMNRRGKYVGSPQADIEGLSVNMAINEIIRSEFSGTPELPPADPNYVGPLSKSQIRERIQERIESARLDTDPQEQARNLAITKGLVALYASGDMMKIIDRDVTGAPISVKDLEKNLEPVIAGLAAVNPKDPITGFTMLETALNTVTTSIGGVNTTLGEINTKIGGIDQNTMKIGQVQLETQKLLNTVLNDREAAAGPSKPGTTGPTAQATVIPPTSIDTYITPYKLSGAEKINQATDLVPGDWIYAVMHLGTPRIQVCSVSFVKNITTNGVLLTNYKPNDDDDGLITRDILIEPDLYAWITGKTVRIGFTTTPSKPDDLIPMMVNTTFKNTLKGLINSTSTAPPLPRAGQP